MPSSSFSTITANFKIDHDLGLVSAFTKIFSSNGMFESFLV